MQQYHTIINIAEQLYKQLLLYMYSLSQERNKNNC